MGWITATPKNVKENDKVRARATFPTRYIVEGMASMVAPDWIKFKVTSSPIHSPGDEVMCSWDILEVWAPEPEVEPEPIRVPAPVDPERAHNMRMVESRRYWELQVEINRARREGRPLDAFSMTLEQGNYKA